MKAPISATAAAAFSSSSSSSLTLFGPAFSRVFRCIWMLEELGVPYTHVPRTFPGSRRAKELHPLGKVPMLVENYQTEDAFTITESANINQYLADKFGAAANNNGSPSLFVPPVGTRLRARQDQLVFTIMTELDAQGVWVHRKHDALGETYGHFPEVVAGAQSHFDKVTEAICKTTLYVHHAEQQNDETDAAEKKEPAANQPPIFLLGPNLFSAADILFVHTLGWAKAIQWGKETWQKDAVLAKYLDTCHQRPAYQRASAIRREESIFPPRRKVDEGGEATTAATATTQSSDDQSSKL